MTRGIIRATTDRQKAARAALVLFRRNAMPGFLGQGVGALADYALDETGEDVDTLHLTLDTPQGEREVRVYMTFANVGMPGYPIKFTILGWINVPGQAMEQREWGIFSWPSQDLRQEGKYLLGGKNELDRIYELHAGQLAEANEIDE